MSAAISGDGWVIDMLSLTSDDGLVMTLIPVEPVTVPAGGTFTITRTVTLTAGDDGGYPPTTALSAVFSRPSSPERD